MVCCLDRTYRTFTGFENRVLDLLGIGYHMAEHYRNGDQAGVFLVSRHGNHSAEIIYRPVFKHLQRDPLIC